MSISTRRKESKKQEEEGGSVRGRERGGIELKAPISDTSEAALRAACPERSVRSIRLPDASLPFSFFLSFLPLALNVPWGAALTSSQLLFPAETESA